MKSPPSMGESLGRVAVKLLTYMHTSIHDADMKVSICVWSCLLSSRRWQQI